MILVSRSCTVDASLLSTYVDVFAGVLFLAGTFRKRQDNIQTDVPILYLLLKIKN